MRPRTKTPVRPEPVGRAPRRGHAAVLRKSSVCRANAYPRVWLECSGGIRGALECPGVRRSRAQIGHNHLRENPPTIGAVEGASCPTTPPSRQTTPILPHAHLTRPHLP